MHATQVSLPGLGIHVSRPSRESTYLLVAKLIAQRSTCKRAAVGCVITNLHGMVIATGYNGNPPNMPHCIDNECLVVDGHCITTLHAEMNALARFTTSDYPLNCYCTYAPCLACLKVGVTKGVMNWYFLSHYEDELRDRFIQWYNQSVLPHQRKIQLIHVKEVDLG